MKILTKMLSLFIISTMTLSISVYANTGILIEGLCKESVTLMDIGAKITGANAGAEATIKDGKLNLRYLKGSIGNQKVAISKKLDVPLPTTGKFEFTMLALNNFAGFMVNFYSGNKVAANVVISKNEGNCTINGAKSASKTPYGYQQQYWPCTSTISFDYGNNRIVLTGSRPGANTVLTDKYYDDAGSNTDSQGNVYTKDSAGAKLGYPITLAGNVPAGAIDKVEIMATETAGNGDGCIWGNVKYTYDYITLKHIENGTSNVIFDDQFDQNLPLFDYGYELVNKNCYPYTDNEGIGFFQVDKVNIYEPCLNIPLGTTIDSGTAVISFTLDMGIYKENSETEILCPSTNKNSFFSVIGNGSSRINLSQNGSVDTPSPIYNDSVSADKVQYTQPFVYNTTQRKFAVVANCNKGTFEIYMSVADNEYEKISLDENTVMTADSNGKFSIDSLQFSGYFGTIGSGELYRYIRYKDININNKMFSLSQTFPATLDRLRTDADIKLKFEKNLYKDSLCNIVTKKTDGTTVECSAYPDENDDSMVRLYYPHGLLYNTKYMVEVTSGLKSNELISAAPMTISFTTEKPPVYRCATKYFNQNDILLQGVVTEDVNIIKAKTKIVNNSGFSREFILITLLYDNSGMLKKGKASIINVNTTEKEYQETIDISGIGVYSVKTFVWNSLTDLSGMPVFDD